MPTPRTKTKSPEVPSPGDMLAEASSVNRTGLAKFLDVSEPTTYRMQKEVDDFPEPFYLNPQQPRWLVRELIAYVERKAAARPSVRRAAARTASQQQTDTEAAHLNANAARHHAHERDTAT